MPKSEEMRQKRVTRSVKSSKGKAKRERIIYDAAGSEESVGEVLASEKQPPQGWDNRTERIWEELQILQEFYSQVFDYSLSVSAVINFGMEYANAFWDGQYLRFGNGDGEVFGDFTRSLTVTAHELAHKLIGERSNLGYYGENGSLNEHYADVLGVLPEQWSLRQGAREATWLVGAEIFQPYLRSGKVKAVRHMKEPGKAYDAPELGKDPQGEYDHYDRRYRGTANNGGVHLNSGIPNRAFARLSEEIGGYAWQTAGALWWECLPLCTSRTTLSGFAELTRTEADKLWGKGDNRARAVDRSWKEVGL